MDIAEPGPSRQPLKPRPLKLGIGLPAYGGNLAYQQAEMWLQLGYALAHAENRFSFQMFSVVDVCGVDVARNRLFEEAIAADVDWLLMIDADTFYRDGFDILQMISSADHEQYSVVVAATPRRDPDDTHLMVYDENRKAVSFKRDGLTRIASAATAMMAVDMRFVRHKLGAPWFRYQWRDGETKPYQSEDHYFCDRVVAAGGKIAVDGRFIANHRQRPTVL